MDERELPTNKIHDYVTWPTTTQIFEDGRGGLAFPDQNNSNCHFEDGKLVSDEGKPVGVDVHAGVMYTTDEDGHDTPISADDIIYIPSYSLDIVANKLNFRVESFTHNEGNVSVTLSDEIPIALVAYLHRNAVLKATTPDTLECTTLVSAVLAYDPSGISGKTIQMTTSDIAIDGRALPFDWSDQISFELVIDLNLSTDTEIFIYAANQTNPTENGVYSYTDGHVRKVAFAPVNTGDDDDAETVLTDPTVNDNVECCEHYRKSYSHREVYDATNKKVGAVTGFGVKSRAFTDCDGGFVDWFTSTGEVNIGNGHGNVFVTGFGLGNMYSAASATVSTGEKLPHDAFDENDPETLHPWLEWGYGTRYDAQTSTNVAALPRDWPFTYISSDKPIFNKLTDTNNITLVKSCAEGVGNLERDVEEDVEDPRTHETTTVTSHVFNNRHHIVLYPDYRQITGKDGYKDGSVVVKPLFLHLPATLDTKDGETIDVTLSIQNVDPEAFGAAGSEKAALSGYYAAMTQPRVYVMGGVQYFSNKKISAKTITQTGTESTGYKYTFVSKNAAYKNDGSTLLDVGTAVRANIVSMDGNSIGNRRTYTAHGVVTANSLENGSTIEFTGKFPYQEFLPYDSEGPMGRRKVFMVCGMAYLVPGDNPSETPMGLVSRYEPLHRNEDESIAGDAGDGGADDMDCYNKFYAINQDGEEDPRIALPKIDKRYLLATVYQTATSTFPWALANRRKLASLSQCWTDEFVRDRENKSLFHLIYEENQKLYKLATPILASAYHKGVKVTTAEQSPISYMTSAPWVSLGSCLRPIFAHAYDVQPVRVDRGNPVRAAREAIEQLSSDFKKMRLLAYTANKARTKVKWLSISETDWPSAGDHLAKNIENKNNSSEQWVVDLVSSAWCSKLRNLPDYITTDTDTNAYPIFSEDDSNGWFSYVQGSSYPYKCESRSSSSTTETLPYAEETKCEVYSSTSLVHLLRKKIYSQSAEQLKLFTDFMRYAETVCGLKLKEDIYMTLANVGGTVLTSYSDGIPTPDDESTTYMEAPKHLDVEWMNPFTNIQSIDSVPYPTITRTDLDNLALDQQVFASADAAQMYRYEYDDADDKIDSISSVLPTESVLAKFLESYVTTYGSKMLLHQYQGSRILLENGTFPAANDPIYIRAIARVKKRMELNHVDSDMVAHYVSDCFGNTSATTRDPNVDHVDASATSIGVSAPPYVTPAAFKNETYTRVYMQFTFSQKAGRWYTTEYRQYPTNYLSPLYGADALDATLPSLWTDNGHLAVTHDATTNTYSNDTERNIWRNPMCDGEFGSYRSNMYLPYSFIPPMDITLGCVPYLIDGCIYNIATGGDGNIKPEYKSSSDDSAIVAPLTRLESPYLPVENGGLGLYPPANVDGGYSSKTDNGVHANFWSVRKFIRPAVSVLGGTDVPAHDEYPESGDPAPSRTGGVISDPTLYRMFDYPNAGVIDYKLPSTTNPDDDMAKTYLLYHEGNDDGIIRANADALGYGVSESEQDIDRN